MQPAERLRAGRSVTPPSTPHRPADRALGTWAAGPDFPQGEDAGDSFSSLLPTGNVLVEAESGRLYEFNGTTLTYSGHVGGGSLVVLPTGEILLGRQRGLPGFWIREPGLWAPTISSAPKKLSRGASYQIAGTQFNGLSQANSFGDEYQTNTNYPLVRITNTASGHVFYARTHDHSSMGVATGSAKTTTNFDVPATAETGASTLVVEANGIPSTPVSVTVK